MKAEPIIIERTFNAPIDKVWKAITDKEQMKQWYFDLKEFRPEVGFEFQFSGGDEVKQYLHLCKITEVIPLKKLTYTWSYEHLKPVTFVTFELFPEGEKTKLKLTHAGVDQFPTDDPNFARNSFVQGWTDIIGSLLKQYLENANS